MRIPRLPPLRVLALTPLAIGGGCHCASVTNNAGADSAVVLVDGNLGGTCVNDSIYRIVDGPVSLGTFDAPGACNTEIIVFSNGDAVALADPSSVFSSSYGTVTIDLTPDRIVVPVVVWRADGGSGAGAPAAGEIALADTLFDENHGGIAFTATYQNVATADSTTINQVAIDVWNGGFCTTSSITSDATIYTAGQINIYYTNEAFTGWHCGTDNIIMIGSLAQPESLTHELGHAFSLGHTNSVDYDGDGVLDFAANNIMVGGGFGRDHFSEGQDLRMSLNASSDLNGLGYRTGATRTCLDSDITDTCPWLALDGVPN
ncbi:MAG: hypothetical protein R3E10_07575 [Gemmatimonadota bacterium]